MKTISSRQNPIVARYRTAGRGELRGALLLDGAHLLVDALNARLRIIEAAVTAEAAGRRDIASIVDRLAQAGAEVNVVAAHVMDALSPVKSASGIVALAQRPDIEADRMYRPEAPLVIVAIDVQDPGNLGAIVRVAEAGGATGVVAAGASADPFGWRALRGSMGSALRLPLAIERDAVLAVTEARRHGCRIAAAMPRDGQSIFEMDYSGAIAILIGGEGAGLPADVAAGADVHMTIPMQPPVESLNAAATAALIVYEAFRQRMTQKPQRAQRPQKQSLR
jgi:TrmH family RNA methyltransferase